MRSPFLPTKNYQDFCPTLYFCLAFWEKRWPHKFILNLTDLQIQEKFFQMKTNTQRQLPLKMPSHNFFLLFFFYQSKAVEAWRQYQQQRASKWLHYAPINLDLKRPQMERKWMAVWNDFWSRIIIYEIWTCTFEFFFLYFTMTVIIIDFTQFR